jgi:hypothetical protein
MDHSTATFYLLRTPGDRATLEVYFGARRRAVLPPSTYTVVKVAPGKHEVRSAPAGNPSGGRALVVSASAAQRRYLCASVAGDTSASILSECSEGDAQALMSQSTLVMPEPSVFPDSPPELH